jgi:hypothetical protein
MEKQELASAERHDVDAEQAIKELMPILQSDIEARIDMCWFDHAWINTAWEPGDLAGTIFFKANANFKFLSNKISLVTNEVYKKTLRFKCKYTMKPRETPKGFALDIEIDPKINGYFQDDQRSKQSSEKNLSDLNAKISKLGGIFRSKVLNDEIKFNFCGQAFKVVRDKKY